MPSVSTFSLRNASIRSWVKIEGVAWNKNDLFAEPPPFAMNRNLYASSLSPRPSAVNLHLCRHVRSGVFLVEHGDGRELRIAEVAFEVGIPRTLGERRLVVPIGKNQPPLLPHDDRGAGVLAHGQHAAGGDIGVLEEVVSDEFVVVARFRVVQDGAQLLEVTRPK